MISTRSAWRRLRSRPLEDHPRHVLGAVALAALFIVIAGAVGLGAADPGRTRYEAEFAQAAGIATGDLITVAGVPVGAVDGVRLDDDRVRVTLAVDDTVRLGAESGAAIKLTTLLGARYVELRPAGAGSLPDRRLPLERTEVPYNLQQALENATVTFEEIDTAAIATSLDSLAGQLQGVPAVLPGLLANMRSLAAIVGDRRGELGELLAGTQRLTETFTQQRADLAAIMGQGGELLAEILARGAAIQRLMDATRRLADQVGALVVEDRPQIDELLAGLGGLLASLAHNDELLRDVLQILPVPVRNFANASGTANEVDFTAPAGPMIDSWMCALSGRAVEGGLAAYHEDCR
ncbi:MCE family protein [Nocardia shimofusensis]|uniref:MCE family protein n=1 Tax=Nocardia shimofusensis TaxID=228596 RepID=UPI000A891688|nr:MlaD family protein [Nocardia shimofusensis]